MRKRNAPRTDCRPRRTTNLNHGAGPSDRPFESTSVWSEAARKWTADYLAEAMTHIRPGMSEAQIRQYAEEEAWTLSPSLAYTMLTEDERAAMVAEGLSHTSIETVALARFLLDD